MKKIYLLVLFLMFIAKNGQAEGILNKKEFDVWIKPEIGVRVLSGLWLGFGAHGGLSLFDNRLAFGAEANGLFHFTIERHVGYYFRVVPFSLNPEENIYLIGRFNQGAIMTMPTPYATIWDPISVQMYGVGRMTTDGGPFSEVGVRIYPSLGFPLPYFSFGYYL